MKKVLILSDNPDLCSFLLTEIIPSISDCVFEICYSSINKNPSMMQSLGALELNIKQQGAEFAQRYDVIFSIHCKQIFPADIVKNTLCINVHPGLNPFNRGWYPQVFSLINKKPIGATIHIMDENIDAGDVIVQESISVDDFDTSLDVYNKVQGLEKKLLSKNFVKIINGDYETIKTSVEGNYNSIQDFQNLCKLDLNHVGSLKEHLDILRALTHGGFNNGYIESASGKIYVSIKFN
jgi:methionyl-tRNA formyltransferase